jgi:hypothetical protein
MKSYVNEEDIEDFRITLWEELSKDEQRDRLSEASKYLDESFLRHLSKVTNDLIELNHHSRMLGDLLVTILLPKNQKELRSGKKEAVENLIKTCADMYQKYKKSSEHGGG